MIPTLLALLLVPLLWLAGAILFDGVHWALHVMQRSRLALLQSVARPHEVHHEWIDRNLVTNLDRQSANIWCHIVPEYLTQLFFTALVAWVLPLAFALVLFVLQTAVFLGILHFRGLDLNHRPTARIDAHPAGWRTPPSYHLLHHAWPNAYFSSYTKLVDRLVGGGAEIAERRYRFQGPAHALGTALRREVEALGGTEVEDAEEADVLVLLDEAAPLDEPVESFLTATRERQLPPEVWALRPSRNDAKARHYRDDVRVCFRTLWTGDESPVDPQRAARRALFWVRRDAHFVALQERFGWGAMRRFLRTEPEAPRGAERVRHRLELAPDAGAAPRS